MRHLVLEAAGSCPAIQSQRIATLCAPAELPATRADVAPSIPRSWTMSAYQSVGTGQQDRTRWGQVGTGGDTWRQVV